MYKRDEILNSKVTNNQIVNPNNNFNPEDYAYDYAYTVKLLGDHGAGRSSFRWRLINGVRQSLPQYISSTEHFIESKFFKIDLDKHSGIRVKFQIFDIGNERLFTAPQRSKNVMPLLLFYEARDLVSRNNLYCILKEERKKWEVGKEPPAILVLTKSDLVSDRDMPGHLEDAKFLLQEFPSIIGITVISSKKSININLPIIELAKVLVSEDLKNAPIKKANSRSTTSSASVVKNNTGSNVTITRVNLPVTNNQEGIVNTVSNRQQQTSQNSAQKYRQPTHDKKDSNSFFNFVNEVRDQVAKIAPWLEREKNIAALKNSLFEYVKTKFTKLPNFQNTSELLVLGQNVELFNGSQDSAVYKLFINDATHLDQLIRLVFLEDDPATKRILAQSILTINDLEQKNSLQRAASIPGNGKVIELLLDAAEKFKSIYKEFDNFIDFKERQYKNTAAHFAVKAGCMENFTVLLRRGADINIAADRGITPIDMIRYIPVEDDEPDRSRKFVRALLDTQIGSDTFQRRYGTSWNSSSGIAESIISMEIIVRQNEDARSQCYIFSECVKLLTTFLLDISDAKFLIAMLGYIEYSVLDRQYLYQDSENKNCALYLEGHLKFAADFPIEDMNVYMRASILTEFVKDANINADINKLVFDQLLVILKADSTKNSICELILTQLPGHKITANQQRCLDDLIKDRDLYANRNFTL